VLTDDSYVGLDSPMLIWTVGLERVILLADSLLQEVDGTWIASVLTDGPITVMNTDDTRSYSTFVIVFM